MEVGGQFRFSSMIGKLLLMVVTGEVWRWMLISKSAPQMMKSTSLTLCVKIWGRFQEYGDLGRNPESEIPKPLLLLSCGWYTFPVKIMN